MKFTKKELKNLRKLSDSVKATTKCRSQKQIKDSKVKDVEMVKFPNYPAISSMSPTIISSTLERVADAVVHNEFAIAKKNLETAKNYQERYSKELNSFKVFVKEYEQSLNKSNALIKKFEAALNKR